jgi:hypothetical protein
VPTLAAGDDSSPWGAASLPCPCRRQFARDRGRSSGGT